MKIYIGQIYVKPGISFPFSLQFQRWLGDELTRRVEASERFRRIYSGNFNLGFNISAKSDIHHPEINGPTVFKRDKDVEFTIFLPHENRNYYESDTCAELLRLLLDCIIKILDDLEIETANARDSTSVLLSEFSRIPGLIDSPKV